MASHQEAFHYSRFLFYVALIHGIYYLITGIWPLLHMPSFIFITGPKYDVWLVRTVGVLILVQGLVCISAAVYKRISKEIVMLAVGAAAGLAVIDIYYASIDRIWNVYLLDALAEVVLIILWLIAWTKSAGRE
jgi:hypothetical protein